MSDSAEVINKFKKLNEINYINQGGCAIAAYGILKYSEKVNVPVKVYYLFDEYAVPDLLRLKNNGNGSCSHAVVELDGKLYDSNGEFNGKKYFGGSRYESLELTEEQILESIAEPRHWNRRFNRITGVKAIKKILDVDIKLTKASVKRMKNVCNNLEH